MDVAILVRGQTNAAIFEQSAARDYLRAEVERVLGFDGVHDRVLLLGEAGQGIAAGTPFIVPPGNGPAAPAAAGRPTTPAAAGRPSTPAAAGRPTTPAAAGRPTTPAAAGRSTTPAAAGRPTTPPAAPAPDGWLAPVPGGGWAATAREKNLLAYLASLSPAQRHMPILTLWLNNEADMRNPAVTAESWEAAIRFDATQIRAALGADTPPPSYLFLWVPSRTALTAPQAATAQAMKQAYLALGGAEELDARPGPQLGDLALAGPDGTMLPAEAITVAHRAAGCIGNIWSIYAKPFADADAGSLPCFGPVAANQWISAAAPADVHIKLHLTTPGPLRPLADPAASGAGWRAVSPGHPDGIAPQWVRAEPDDYLTLHFAAPLEPGVKIYYGLGGGRIALADGAVPGAAIYDSAGFVLTVSANGISPSLVK